MENNTFSNETISTVKNLYLNIGNKKIENKELEYWKSKLAKGWNVCKILYSMRLKDVINSVDTKKRTYFVSSKGNNSNPGTKISPWKTIQRAVDVLQPGDKVYVRRGTYYGPIILKHSGNNENYITFQAYPGEVPVITRLDRDYNKDTVVLSPMNKDVSFIRFIGFKINEGIRCGIVVYAPAKNIEILNCEISHQNINIPKGKRIGWGIGLISYNESKIYNCIIDGNYIHDNHTGNPSKTGIYNSALSITGKVSRFKVTNNIIVNNDFIGIDVIGHQKGEMAILGMNDNGLIDNNIVMNNGLKNKWVSGIYLDGGYKILLQNNLIINNKGKGLKIGQSSKGSITERIIFRNNILWNNEDSIEIGDFNRGISKNISFLHNVIGNNMTDEIKIFNYSGINFVNNIFAPTYGKKIFISQTKILDVEFKGNMFTKKDSIGMEHVTKPMVFQNPDFVDPGSMNFRLKQTSPCINKGAFLTNAIVAGKGNKIKVKNAEFFSDGLGLVPGDIITIGERYTVRINKVDYDKNILYLDNEISWKTGDSIAYEYSGTFPDIGFCEY
ncbi:right-handed parallel beta-helix repeat-containing protein [bacterium]|nr:right-handed parallel beta-helix repeat-containing protein [bacterium]